MKRANSQTEFDFNTYSLLEQQSDLIQPQAEEFHEIVPSIEKNFVPAYLTPLIAPALNSLNAFNSNSAMKCAYRNSFDFLELESQNLLEMTGDRYNTMINNQQQVLFSQFYQYTGNGLMPAPLPAAAMIGNCMN